MGCKALERFINMPVPGQKEDFVLETSPAVEELKTRLSYHKQLKNRFKPFYWSWAKEGLKSDQVHEEMRLRNGGNCCCVDIIGRPQVAGRDNGFLPYQKLLHQILHERKCIWIK